MYQAHPPHSPPEETEARKRKCSTSNGPSASYCPSWCEGLFRKCGGAGPKFHMGPSGEGWPNSPVR